MLSERLECPKMFVIFSQTVMRLNLWNWIMPDHVIKEKSMEERWLLKKCVEGSWCMSKRNLSSNTCSFLLESWCTPTCLGCLVKKIPVFMSNCYITHSPFQGLRPDLPENAHPKLIDLMQRCWDAVSDNRPSFSEIKLELEVLLQEVQVEISNNSFKLLYYYQLPLAES